MKVTPETLNSVMDFDHVIIVHGGDVVTDAEGIYAPFLHDGELDSDEWELLDGYSGQHGYSGPVMHNSEFIGGGMARDILATPGTYVAIIAHWTGEDESEDDVEGWAVARLIKDDDGAPCCRAQVTGNDHEPGCYNDGTRN